MFALIFVSVIIVSLLSFVGVAFLALKKKLLEKILIILVAFASGTLLGSAFLHLLPESLVSGESAFIFVLLGIITFFVLEKFLYWRHCHLGKCEVHEFAQLNVIGDGLHNFIDGVIIAASFLVNIPLGLATTLAIIFHEIPQEIGDFSILLYGGLKVKKALLYNFLSALTAVFGAVFAYFFSSYVENFTLAVPFAAGGFIYIASTDLIPELHKRKRLTESFAQFSLLLVGIILMWLLKALFA
ncbi:MAG: ZIP family metal transporter [Candidatus Aenigmarchaeota archaeon]|nr:ZIP family metal transporter [Candidatus Aenigmarchaeota archaeon]